MAGICEKFAKFKKASTSVDFIKSNKNIMSRFNLRLKQRVSYFDPEEPNFDEYVYCDKCTDYVFEYCSIHGPLLVIPDAKVPAVSNFPSYVPRAALTIPNVFLHLAPSIIPGAGLGVFTTLTLPQGVRFGPYIGQHTVNSNSNYCWQIYDKNNKPLHVIDSADANNSNWMRYVNCSRYWQEQNLVACQYQGQLYYRTIKTVPKFTELMVFYGSEYANMLRIDLRRYNSPQCYYGNVQKRHIIDKENARANPNTYQNANENDGKKQKTNDIKLVCMDWKNNKGNIDNEHTVTSDISKLTFKNASEAKSSFICNYCGENFAIKAMLCLHLKYHLENNKQNEFDKNVNVGNNENQSVLQKHDSQVELKYRCNNCKYASNFLRNFNRHLKNHGEKPHSCTICKYKCIEKHDLERHILRVHNQEKQFSCTICDFKCSCKTNLKRHIRTHTGEKPYSCTICKYKCIKNHNLQRHIRTHTGEKPFSCTICDFKSSCKTNLTKHIRTHTGEKPFSCTICEYKCIEKTKLKNHIRTHTGEKLYSCTICEYKCSENRTLKKHIQRHTGEKPLC